MKTYDVVIIGAGLAGLQCARSLARENHSVFLVDRKHDLTKGVHTTGIFVRKTFEDFDFPAGTLGNPISDVTLYSPDLKSIDLTSGKPEFRVGKMGALYGTYLKECIDLGVTFSNGTRYVAAQRQQQSGNVVMLEKDGRSFNVIARVLVGADGAASRVARDLGLDQNREWIVGYEEVFESKNKTAEPRLHCFLDSELAPGYLAWLADDGEEVHVGVGGYAKNFDPQTALKIFKKKIGALIDETCAGDAIERRGGRIPVGGVLRRIANNHGVLIGDAAGAVSPLTAGGLDPCLRLSGMAADLIAARIHTGNSKILLELSGKKFRARFISRIWMRRIIAAFQNRPLLELAFTFLKTSIGKRLAAHVFFGRGSFPDIKRSKVFREQMNISGVK